MRKLIPLVAIACLLAFSNNLYAQGYTGDGFKDTIIGTEHDLGTHGEVTAPTVGGQAVCEFCHAPHKLEGMGNGPGPTPAVPLLWNVQLKTGPYAVYGGSSTFNADDLRSPATASPTSQAAYMSLLCLSCHDGTITASSFYFDEVLFSAFADFDDIPNIGEGGGLGLSNDHPVDFTYSAALATADGGLQTPTEGVGVRIPYVGATPLPLFKDAAADTSGRVECATCHNPHNDSNPFFLRITNDASAICLNCHGSGV